MGSGQDTQDAPGRRPGQNGRVHVTSHDATRSRDVDAPQAGLPPSSLPRQEAAMRFQCFFWGAIYRL
eukprot:176104-Chlamydomonas_euryale.AAC.1